jgi:hypothetical protein
LRLRSIHFAASGLSGPDVMETTMRKLLTFLIALAVAVSVSASTVAQVGGLMFPGPGGHVSSGGGGGCSQATTFLAAVSVDPAHTSAYTAMICGMVTDGTFAKLDIFYVFATQNSTAALTNIITPGTHNATVSNAPTFTADSGYVGNGTTSLIDSGLAAASAVKYTQNSSSIFGWVTGNTQSNGGPVTMNGVWDFISPFDFGGNAVMNMHGNVNVIYATTTANGLFVASRTSSVQVDFYNNATNKASSGTNTSSAPASANFTFLTADNNGYTGNTSAGGAGADLNSTDEANLYARLHTFLNTVNSTLFP